MELPQVLKTVMGASTSKREAGEGFGATSQGVFIQSSNVRSFM